MSEKLIVKQLSPLECRDLVERLSGPSFRDNSADAKCLVIMDVRTPLEYGLGHLNGSINLDFRSPSFRDEIARLDRDKAYLLYCRTGNRSGRVLQLMSSSGFRELYNLTKGIEQWQREGYEVVSG
ncbi:MAG: rhodanese-like domain-containing protein [Methanothrix sp.]|jgi:rhodanese-related sulfurtransferase|nr:rhodanese-like domain-containing protein [Methanothrix sp.]